MIKSYEPHSTLQFNKNYNKKTKFLLSRIDKACSSRNNTRSNLHESKNIENYIRQKFTQKDIPIREIMLEPHSKNRLSFESYNKSEAFRSISKKKRKFGEFWREISISFDSDSQPQLSDRQTKSFDATSSLSINKTMEKSQKINKIIKDYLLKKLGLKHKEKNMLKKKITIKNKKQQIKTPTTMCMDETD